MIDVFKREDICSNCTRTDGKENTSITNMSTYVYVRTDAIITHVLMHHDTSVPINTHNMRTDANSHEDSR